MNSIVLLASNLHCPSCISHVNEVLSYLPGIISEAETSLITQAIRVSFDSQKLNYNTILDTLIASAFDIEHVTVYNSLGSAVEDFDVASNTKARQHLREQEQHLANCDACKEDLARSASADKLLATEYSHHPPSDASDSVDRPAVVQIESTGDDNSLATYTATVSIEGMTCGSCVGIITRKLQELDYIVGVNIDLLNNGGSVDFRGKYHLNDVLAAFDEAGYPASLIELSSPQLESTIYVASVSIEGMTCGSCVGTITRKLQELDFIISIDIDLLNNAGSIKYHGKDHVGQILVAFDGVGYSAKLIKLSESGSKSVQQRDRTVDIQIDGMHCERCPERIVKALQVSLTPEKLEASHFQILKPPSVKQPLVRLNYRPDPAKDITLRCFISAIQKVDAAFTVGVYHPPTIEERSRRIQGRERWAILYRMIFTGIVAVPSFIIGVVFMALVPSHNSTRMWFEQPIWAGNASRTEWALLILTTPVMFFGTDIFHRRAVKEIWAIWKPRSKIPILRRFYRFGSMNMLISIATIVAYFASLAVLAVNASSTRMDSMEGNSRMSTSYFDTITFLTFFILTGKYLEAYSKAKTGDAVALLTKIRPNDADLIDDDGSRTVPVDQLEIGDSVQIPRGHSPPADGIIEKDGVFSFDESSLTGESKPVQKIKGDSVYTGTVNVADPVQIKVTEIGGTSMLDQIIDVVRSGQAKRAPIERFADVLTGYFVPIVTLLAVMTWVIWLSLGVSGRLPRAWLDTEQGGWAYWSLEFAIAVFVVACPCGIGLAAPTALFVGGGLAARRGILVQGGGQAFQEASNLDAIVFDKTGTLTQGKMEVTEYDELSTRYGLDLVLAVSRAMERNSSHPVAQAIAAYCSSSAEELTMSDVRELPGYGMTAKFSIMHANSEKVIGAAIGNEKLLHVLEAEMNASTWEKANDSVGTPNQPESRTLYLEEALYRHQSKGHSIAVVAVRQADHFEPLGIFGLSDPIRPEAPSVVATLRKLNLSVHLCTGDNATTASAVASQLNIPASNVRTGILPGGKADYIHELQHSRDGGRRLVAFAGDGLNDTPALTASDVSISLSSGSDIAIDASSFILLNSHLAAICELITLSKRVFWRVKINFFWAGVYNITLIPVAAGIFFALGATQEHGGWRMSPVWAAVAMAASSVSVVLSSLALKLPEIKWSFGKRNKS